MATKFLKFEEDKSYIEFSIYDGQLMIMAGIRNTTPNAECFLSKDQVSDLISFLNGELERINN